MVKALEALGAVRKHLVLKDDHPELLAQVALLIKGDKMTQLTCKKNALTHKVEALDDDMWWKKLQIDHLKNQALSNQRLAQHRDEYNQHLIQEAR